MKGFKGAIAFAATVLSVVSGVWGLITAATSGGGGLTFAIVAVSVVLLAVPTYLLVPRLFEAYVRLGNYQTLVDELATARETLKNAEDELDGVPLRLAEERAAGHKDAAGSLLAGQADAKLEATAAKAENEQLTIYVRVTGSSAPYVGSRYLMQSTRLQTRRGIFVLVQVDASGTAELALIERHKGSNAFWDAAMERAAVHDAPPENVEIVPDPLLADLFAGLMTVEEK